MAEHPFGPSVELDVVRVRNGEISRGPRPVATEVPCTILANDVEVATLLCTPADLRELAVGFMHSSALIGSVSDIQECVIDETRWVVSLAVKQTPDPRLLAKRMYTAGCGKGVMYTSLSEIGVRRPLESSLRITAQQIGALAQWLQHCSELYRSTGGIHTAALSEAGDTPERAFDDIGRHNAVDKVVGDGLLLGAEFNRGVLISSGRTSSEILHKARRASIPVTIARGAPTHQTILRAQEMGVTVIGFARGGGFAVYSHEERIVL